MRIRQELADLSFTDHETGLDIFSLRMTLSSALFPISSQAEIIVSRVLNALGELCLEQMETQSAMARFRNALSIQEDYLVKTHPNMLSTKLNLGRAYTDLESYL